MSCITCNPCLYHEPCDDAALVIAPCRPLSLVEKISALQFTSLFGVMALLYLVVAVAIHFAVDAAADSAATLGAVQLFQTSEEAVSASAIVMFAFTCQVRRWQRDSPLTKRPTAEHDAWVLTATYMTSVWQVNVPSLYHELNDRKPAVMSAVSFRAVTLCLVFYLVVGLTGYADFPHSTRGNLLNNYCLLTPARTARVGSPPRVMLPAFGAIAMTILFAYPVNVYPTRYTFNAMCFAAADTAGKNKLARHVGLTLFIATTTLVVALIVPDISIVFSLMGGTASAYAAAEVPLALPLRASACPSVALHDPAICHSAQVCVLHDPSRCGLEARRPDSTESLAVWSIRLRRPLRLRSRRRCPFDDHDDRRLLQQRCGIAGRV